jgi:hypothetical protein
LPCQLSSLLLGKVGEIARKDELAADLSAASLREGKKVLTATAECPAHSFQLPSELSRAVEAVQTFNFEP